MSTFSDNTWFDVEHCYKCGMAFAMPTDFKRRKLKDRDAFYCPSGHGQVYTGKTEAQKLQEELTRVEGRLAQSLSRANTLTRERDNVTKAHNKMRVRVMNGVCPCCNRSFQNLREHMKTEHADFGDEKTMKALRTAFGMTQADVAEEVGTPVAYVSRYESGGYVPVAAAKCLSEWCEKQGAA